MGVDDGGMGGYGNYVERSGIFAAIHTLCVRRRPSYPSTKHDAHSFLMIHACASLSQP